jgi:hypothetical protein
MGSRKYQSILSADVLRQDFTAITERLVLTKVSDVFSQFDVVVIVDKVEDGFSTELTQ